MSSTFKICLAALLALSVSLGAQAAPPKKRAHADGSKTRAVHAIPLLDEEGNEIGPKDVDPKPVSLQNTCGDCHNYDTISTGWHFNASAGVTKPGRPGEPWVVVEESAGVMLPVTSRGWAGTWKPEEVGLTPWSFTQRFAHHMPGGDAGQVPEDKEPLDPNARWDISGHLEINCLGCHNTDADQNQTFWAIQGAAENFKWAATAAGGLGYVTNAASRVPNSYIPGLAPNPDNTYAAPPIIQYNANKFDAKNRVFFDVRRNVPANRCYYCHSAVWNDQPLSTAWQHDNDVHLAAGLTCTDCHRNGIGHDITRGYEGETDAASDVALSCRGCHLGTDKVAAGRLGAPVPKHKGLPVVHFDKMSCTACHSGPKPQAQAQRVRLSRTNRMGVHGAAIWDTDLPMIQAPVFAPGEDGKITPHYAFWPAYYGTMKDGKIAPVSMDAVKGVIKAIQDEEAAVAAKAKADADEAAIKTAEETKAKLDAMTPEEKAATEAKMAEEAQATQAAENERLSKEVLGAFKPLNNERLTLYLTRIGEAIGGEVVYVNGDTISSLKNGAIAAAPAPGNAAYLWPMAHDVRPAAQALGSGGCTDCHSGNSPFFYGQVAVDKPTEGAASTKPMYEFEKLSPTLLKHWGLSFQMRPLFKVMGFGAAALVAAVLVLFAFAALSRVLKALNREH